MGQLTLRDLAGIGDAAARCLQKVQSSQFWSACTPALRPLVTRLAEGRGDCDNLGVPPPFVLGLRSYAVDQDEWSADIWLIEEYERGRETAAWYLEVGRQAGFEDQSPQFDEVASRLGINRSGYFAHFVVIWKDTSDEVPPFTLVLEPGPPPIPLVDILSAGRLMNTSRSEVRKVFQELDALSRHATVAFDPRWSANATRTSVMAQVAEWLVRVQGSEYAPWLPELGQDALEWWAGWATSVGRRGEGNALSPSDVYQIAKRTVRPDTPAGHRKYWKLSSRAFCDDDLASRAAGMQGIARRTVYHRLKQAGRTIGDFKTDPDPLRSLYGWLQENGSQRRIPPKRRLIRDELEKAGLSREAARKLERRTRRLPNEEQVVKLTAAMRRAKRGSPPLPLGG